MVCREVPESVLVRIKFGIRGNMRFLSHAETIRVFHRACLRANIKIQYSGGFNPHPRMSLPLPRPVGVESEDDILCFQIKASLAGFDSEKFMANLSNHLPEGFDLISIDLFKEKITFQPNMATYIVTLRGECEAQKFNAEIESLMRSESVIVQRQNRIGVRKEGKGRRDKSSKVRNIDVRGFLNSIEICEQDESKGARRIAVTCNISSAGSIRVDEILKLLKLDTAMLAEPVRRTNIVWQRN